MEIRAGSLRSSLDSFKKIYRQDEPFPTLAAGFGASQSFLTARYVLFKEWGEPIIKGAPLEGMAHWQQEIMSLGLRTYEGSAYAEVGLAIVTIEETIQGGGYADDPLYSHFQEDDIRGGLVAAGFYRPMLLGIHLSGEVCYYYLPLEIDNAGKKVNTGGWVFSLGIGVML